MANTLKWGTDYLLTTMTLDAKGTALYVENNRKLPKLNHYFLVYQVRLFRWSQAAESSPHAGSAVACTSSRCTGLAICIASNVDHLSSSADRQHLCISVLHSDAHHVSLAALKQQNALRFCGICVLAQPQCCVQVGNYTQDRYYYGRLEDMTATANPRPVYFTATANGAALQLVGF